VGPLAEHVLFTFTHLVLLPPTVIKQLFTPSTPPPSTHAVQPVLGQASAPCSPPSHPIAHALHADEELLVAGEYGPGEVHSVHTAAAGAL
jgi:hypothetical protein